MSHRRQPRKGKRCLLLAPKNFLAAVMAAAALASAAVVGASSQPDSERECHCIYGNDGVPVKAQCGALLIYLHGQAPDQLADLRGVIADEGGKVFLDGVRDIQGGTTDIHSQPPEAADQFAAAAEDAVKRYRFHPLKAAEKGVAVRLCFSLNSDAPS